MYAILHYKSYMYMLYRNIFCCWKKVVAFKSTCRYTHCLHLPFFQIVYVYSFEWKCCIFMFMSTCISPTKFWVYIEKFSTSNISKVEINTVLHIHVYVNWRSAFFFFRFLNVQGNYWWFCYEEMGMLFCHC